MTLFTTAEAAKQLGLAVRTIQLAVQSGEIPSVQIGRHRFIRPAALAKFQPRPRGRPPKAK